MIKIMSITLKLFNELGNNSFAWPNGREIKVKTVFQIWAKHRPESYVAPQIKTCDSFVNIYNICVPYKPSRSPSNVDKIGKCDVYLPRSFWSKDVAKATFDFADIPYKDDYGIVVKRQHKKVVAFIAQHNWSENFHTSTNSSKSLRKDLIKEQLIAGGFYD